MLMAAVSLWLSILRIKSKASIQYVSGVWFGTMLLRHHLPLRFNKPIQTSGLCDGTKQANTVPSGKQKTSVAKF